MAMTFQQLVDLAYSAGCPADAAQTAAAIALAESSGNPRNHNAIPPDNSYGLWQINMLGKLGPERRALFGLTANEDLYDPQINARAMVGISKGCSNWRPWTTYTHGAYRKFLERVQNPPGASGDYAEPRGSADDGSAAVDGQPEPSFIESHKKEIIVAALILATAFVLTR